MSLFSVYGFMASIPTSLDSSYIVFQMADKPGFEVPYFDTFFLNGTNHYEKKFILFSPWLLKSPAKALHRQPTP